MQYVFFWVFPRRLRFKSRRFGTLYRFHLPRQVKEAETSIFKPQTPRNTQKKTYCIEILHLIQVLKLHQSLDEQTAACNHIR